MDTSKIAGRASLLQKDRETEAIVAWLTDQPEVTRVIPRAWKPGGSKGKTGLRIDDMNETRISASVFHGTGRQEVLITAKTADAAARVITRAAEKYTEFPLPGEAKRNGNGHAPTRPIDTTPKLTGVPVSLRATAQAEEAKDVKAGKLETSLRRITPDVAAGWLENNKLNRPMSQRVVDRYASDMKNGRWGISESVIAFDTKGNLINGQHRLWAVVDSNASITAHVATGYSPDAITYFDDGYRRDNAQVYNLTHGSDLGKQHLSIARRLAGGGWRKAGGADVKVQELSRQDAFEVLDRFRDGIDFAVREVHSKGKRAGSGGVKTSAVLSVVARAFYTVDKERLLQFCTVLTTGLSTGAHDNAAVLLRNWLMSTNVNTSVGQNDAYAKTERALDAFMKNEHLTRNLYPATVELYPLPGEETEKALAGPAARTMRSAARTRAKATKDFHRAKAAGKGATA